MSRLSKYPNMHPTVNMTARTSLIMLKMIAAPVRKDKNYCTIPQSKQKNHAFMRILRHVKTAPTGRNVQRQANAEYIG